MIALIGAPFDLCGLRLGSRLGPAALRLAGLPEALAALEIPLQDRGDIPVSFDGPKGNGMRDFVPLLQTMKSLKAEVEAAFNDFMV
ncbi:hypothetical protein EON79_19175 [bacterium]|nr:MAG: hypothetical protein EON79_19175 [bacterium]